MEDTFKSNVKQSFAKAREDIELLKKELNLQKEVLIKQNDVTRVLNGKLNEILSKLDEILKKQLKVNNTDKPQESKKELINQSFNQSINQQSFNQQMPSKQPINDDLDSSTGNEGVNQSFNHLINQQLINQMPQEQPDPNFKALKDSLEGVFRRFSKQELKTFLTIYQLEDENIEPNYHEISLRMQLSEHCIRSHISSLTRKIAPITKRRLNNRTNIIHIRKDFKALNLKQRLINMFYETDPHQTTLFELK